MTSARHRLRRPAALLLVAVGSLLAVPAAAHAAQPVTHPLGNFTINHFNGLQVQPDQIRDALVIDAAEIPTLQERDLVNPGGGDTTAAERATFASQRCADVAEKLVLRVDGSSVGWSVSKSSFEYNPGAAGLYVSRLECSLAADVDLSKPASVSFIDGYLSDRVGWREITATGDGVDLGERDVATTSISDRLRSYPNDLLTSPLDQRSIDLRTRPGVDAGGGALPTLPRAGPVSSCSRA